MNATTATTTTILPLLNLFGDQDDSYDLLESTECSIAMAYIQSPVLRFSLGLTACLAITSVVSMIITSKKLINTAHVDRPFKEYIFICYLLITIQNSTIIFLHGLLLLLFTFWPYCEVQMPKWLCYGLRFLGSLCLSCLIYMNVALTIFRLVAIFSDRFTAKKQLPLMRSLGGLALITSSAEAYYKYGGFNFSGTVTYCSGNNPTLFVQLNIFSYILFGIEVLVNVSGCCMKRLYQRDLHNRKTYDVNTGLLRRQIAHTFELFLPFSICHSVLFLVWLFISIFYRFLYGPLDEVNFYAVSLTIYLPSYFGVIAPWLMFVIVKRAERKTVSQTSKLLAKESDATNIHFGITEQLWADGKMGKTTTAPRMKILTLVSKLDKRK